MPDTPLPADTPPKAGKAKPPEIPSWLAGVGHPTTDRRSAAASDAPDWDALPEHLTYQQSAQVFGKTYQQWTAYVDHHNVPKLEDKTRRRVYIARDVLRSEWEKMHSRTARSLGRKKTDAEKRTPPNAAASQALEVFLAEATQTRAEMRQIMARLETVYQENAALRQQIADRDTDILSRQERYAAEVARLQQQFGELRAHLVKSQGQTQAIHLLLEQAQAQAKSAEARAGEYERLRAESESRASAAEQARLKAETELQAEKSLPRGLLAARR